MSTSNKTPASIRQGGPGASHEKAKAPLDVKKRKLTVPSAPAARSPAAAAGMTVITPTTRSAKAARGRRIQRA
jgi:hypothetical protein